MTRQEMQRDFMYLFERMGEPLGMGMKGPIGNMVYYNVPPDQIVSSLNLIVHLFIYHLFILKCQACNENYEAKYDGSKDSSYNCGEISNAHERTADD